MTLLPFNSRCPKCNEAHHLDTNYRFPRTDAINWLTKAPLPDHPEALLISCRICGFDYETKVHTP